jgi:hypothetical protein
LVDDAIVNNVEADIVHVEDSNTPVTVNSVVNVEPRTSAVSSAAKAVAKRKVRNMKCFLVAITTTTTTTTTTTSTTTMSMAAIAAVAPWLIGGNGAARTPRAMRMAKMRRVKPTVDTIIKIGNVMDQASLIRAVVNHPALVAASALAGLLSTKEQAVSLYVSEQTTWMLGRARSNKKVQGKSKREK